MKLAEAATEVALQDLATLRTANKPIPESTRSLTEQADEATIPFVRLLTGIRQTIALETRIALIAKAARKPGADPVPMDWDAIRRALHMTAPNQTPAENPTHTADNGENLTQAEPGAANSTRTTPAANPNPAAPPTIKPKYRPTEEELDDPNFISPDDQEILSLCQELGISIDFTNLDELNELHNSKQTVPLAAEHPANPYHRAPPTQLPNTWPSRSKDEKT